MMMMMRDKVTERKCTMLCAQVRVANLTFDLGYLEYQQDAGPLSLEVIIAIAMVAGAVVLIVAIVVIAVVVRQERSKNKVRRDYQHLLRQLTELECSVRDQCKQGTHSLRSYRVRGGDGICAEHLTVESYTVFICQQSYLLLFGIPSPTHSFFPGLKPSFSTNLSHCSPYAWGRPQIAP